MNKILFIYLSSIALFLVSIGQQNFSAAMPHVFVQKLEKRFFSYPSHSKVTKKYGYLSMAFLTGNRRPIQKSLLAPYKRLNMYHLFTPSGLHLGSFFMMILFLLRSFNKKFQLIVHTSIVAILSYYVFAAAGYYSLKRMLAFRIHTLWMSKIPSLQNKMGPFSIFLITFLIDFFIGTYKDSPLSFCYSYIFLGCIMACLNRSGFVLLSTMVGGQIIAAFLNQQSVYLPSLLFNFLLSSMFTLLFPVLLLAIAIPSLGNWIIPYAMGSYHWLVNFLANILGAKGNAYPDFLEIFLILLLCFKSTFQWKKRLILGYCLLQSCFANIGPSFLNKSFIPPRGLERSEVEFSKVKLVGKRKYYKTFEQLNYYNGKKMLFRCRHKIAFYHYHWVCKKMGKRLRIHYVKRRT